MGLLATAHGEDAKSLFKRDLYKALIDREIFKYAVVLERNGREHTYRIEQLR